MLGWPHRCCLQLMPGQKRKVDLSQSKVVEGARTQDAGQLEGNCSSARRKLLNSRRKVVPINMLAHHRRHLPARDGTGDAAAEAVL